MSARVDIGAIGLRIRERRMAIGLTQEGLAKKLDVTAQAVSKWETGVGCPDIYVLPDIANVLEMSVDELLGIQQVKADLETDAVTPTPTPMPTSQENSADEKTVEEDTQQSVFFEESNDVFKEAEEWVESKEAQWEKTAEWVESKEAQWEKTAEEAESKEAQWEKTAEEAETKEAQWEWEKTAQETEWKATAEEVNWEEISQKIQQKITDVLGDSGFGASLSRYVSANVRSAMASAKKATKPDAGRRPIVTRAYADSDITLRGLDIEVSGSGEIVVDEGHPGVWEAKISAPEFMFEQIICQTRNGILYIKVPSISRFGYRGSSPKVRVAIQTGFTLGESLCLNVHGSADTEIHPDFERSEVHIAGSGDVEMANAGILTYSVSGSGDLSFGDAQDASIRISGSGDAHGGCLTGRTIVHISGSGDFSADAVSGTLEAVAAGSGDFSINEGVLDSLKIRTSGSGDFYGPNLEVQDAEIRITGGGDAVLGRVKGKLIKNVSKSASVRIRQLG